MDNDIENGADFEDINPDINFDVSPSDSLDETIQRELNEALSDMGAESFVDTADVEHQSQDEQIHRGKVIAIHGDDIFVDMGGKNQGVLPATQFEDEPLPEVNSVIEFTVQGYDQSEGLVLLSRQGAVQAAAWETLERGQVLEGRVTGHNKGGLEMDFGGIRAFMPISQIELHRVEELGGYVNQRLRCQVTEIDRSQKNVVVSRRAVLQQEEEEAREKTVQSLTEGQTVVGTVKTIMPYGAFVDIGGLDGLLHVSDMSYGRVENPETVVKQGQQLEVMILKFDRESRKISLGLKQVLPDPWTGAESKWPEGELVTAVVTKLMDFGCFVQLEEGVEGLIPISELSFEKRISHPKEVVSVGEAVKARVLQVDPAQRRISLSIKRVGDDPWVGASVRWPAESVAEGVVRRTTQFGAFVELTAGVEGLVHISELSDDRVRSVEDVVKVGQTIQAKVLGVDEENRRISLSIKQLVTAPEYTGAEQDQRQPERKRPKRKKPLKGGLDF